MSWDRTYRRVGWGSAMLVYLNMQVSTLMFACLYPAMGGAWWYYAGLVVISIGQFFDFYINLKVTYGPEHGLRAAHHPRPTLPSWGQQLWGGVKSQLGGYAAAWHRVGLGVFWILLVVGSLGFAINAFLSNHLMLSAAHLPMVFSQVFLPMTVAVAFLSSVMLSTKNLAKAHQKYQVQGLDGMGLPLRLITLVSEIFFDLLAMHLQTAWGWSSPWLWLYALVVIVPQSVTRLMFAVSTYRFHPEKHQVHEIWERFSPARRMWVHGATAGVSGCLLMVLMASVVRVLTARQLMFHKLGLPTHWVWGLSLFLVGTVVLASLFFEWTHLQRARAVLIHAFKPEVLTPSPSSSLTPMTQMGDLQGDQRVDQELTATASTLRA